MNTSARISKINKQSFGFIFLLFFICFIFLFTNLIDAQAATANLQAVAVKNISIVFNQTPLTLTENPPLLINNRTLLPLRILFETMQATVNWDKTTNTITATRGTDTVTLSLNAKTVTKNGQTMQLDVAPFVTQNRTYIPLRFVGEAFGAQVDWNQTSKTIAITLANPDGSPVVPTPPNILLNNTKLTFSVDPFKINGLYHINLNEFLTQAKKILPDYMYFTWDAEYPDGQTYSDEDLLLMTEEEATAILENTLFGISVDGVNMSFYPEQNTMTVNGASYPLNTTAKITQNAVYVPYQLIARLFSATTTTQNNTTYIYINRPKFKSQLLSIVPIASVMPSNIPTAKLEGDRILTVSDNPELLNPTTLPEESATLSHTNIVRKNGSQEHRVFGWHFNQMGVPIKIGITIENLSKYAITLNNVNGIYRTTPNSWVNYDVGMPLAEGLLSNQMIHYLPDNFLVKPGEIALLQSFTLKPGEMLGFLNDLQIDPANGKSAVTYRIRVVASLDLEQDLTAITSLPLNLDKTLPHPRGNWSSSIVSAEVPKYEVGGSEVAWSISNGFTDYLMSLNTALQAQQDTQVNIGHFGATYKLKVPIVNETGAVQTVQFRLSARGGQYSGAVKTPDGIFLVPLLNPHLEMADLYTYSAPRGRSYVEFEIMHAGGSNLPVALNISTLDLVTTDEE